MPKPVFECTETPRRDGSPARVYRSHSGSARGTLLVAHGMAEHAGRYQRLAEFLAPRGWNLVAADQRGHGPGCARAHGDPGPQGWQAYVDDLHQLHQQLSGPVVLLGHSMGSFIGQAYLAEHGTELAGAILSAPDGQTGRLRRVALGLITLEAKLRGRAAPSQLAIKLSFAQFNKVFAPNRTAFDWLSQDALEVDCYVADPLCGFVPATGLWLELLGAIGTLEEPATRARVPARLPILLLAGEADPACRGAAGPLSLAAGYRAAGVASVKVRTYPGARHELLNETCREQAMSDLADWLDQHINQA